MWSCKAPIERIIIIALQRTFESVEYECDRMETGTGLSASDLASIYDDNAEVEDKSNVFSGRVIVG